MYPIGIIIHSTILSTQAAVIAQYGGITWVEHSGYFLRGRGSSETVLSGYENAKYDAGNDDLIVPYHNHSVAAKTSGSMSKNTTHTHKNNSNGSFVGAYCGGSSATCVTGGTGYNLASQTASTNIDHTHSIPAHDTNYAGTSGNEVNANIPKYKAVYIWERTA